MADVQIENGFTKIANEILENIVKVPLNGTQLRIIMVIWRSTYGYSKKAHDISLSFLSTAMNASRAQIKRELDKLIQFNIIKITSPGSFTCARQLMFNKDFDSWCTQISIQDSKKDTVLELEHGTVLGLEYGTVLGLEYQKRKHKESIKKDICPFLELLDIFHNTCLSLSKIQKLTESRKKKMSARWIELPDLDKWKKLFELVEKTPFLKGENDRNWKASFDWLIDNDSNIVKVLEGQYMKSTRNLESTKIQDHYRRVE